MKRFKGILIAIGISAIFLTIRSYLPEQKSTSVNEPVYENVIVETTEYAKNETKETVDTPTAEAPLETKEPAEAIEEKNTLFCTLTVRCDKILNNLERLVSEKIELIPENGIILPETELEFSEGDTVFDVLENELKNRNIHLEFNKVSMYDSVYIEGIGNLYEFDAGDLSGWIYRVNGDVPSVGCSQYRLKNGDIIEFLYTCNMGRDL